MDKYCDTSKLSIRQIDKASAKKMVVKYHYSKLWTKCSVALGLFHLTGNEHSFFDEPEEKMVGVIVYGDPIGRLTGQSISDEIKQSSFKNEETKAVINLIFTGNFIVQRQQAFMKPFGITMQQFNVLRILQGQKGQAISVLSITERMLDKMSNASRLVDKLFAKKLVSRVQCEKDRRAVDVYILPAGSALIAQIEVHLDEFGKQISQLGEENLKQLNELLDQFRASIS